jgi:1-acyl-sn-glycerol-3-phosphate acyltransferase
MAMLQFTLLVANHRSYFDPIIMLNQQTFPVGKRKSNHGHSSDTFARFLLIERSEKCGKLNKNKALNKGYSVINFPEGTFASIRV